MKVLDHITILVVEESRPIRMLLRVVLEAAGAQVIDAEDKTQALRLANLYDVIDVVIADLQSHDFDHEDLLALLRQKYPQLPLVACIDRDTSSSQPETLALTDVAIQKPFVPADLVRAVTIALTRHRALVATA